MKGRGWMTQSVYLHMKSGVQLFELTSLSNNGPEKAVTAHIYIKKNNNKLYYQYFICA